MIGKKIVPTMEETESSSTKKETKKEMPREEKIVRSAVFFTMFILFIVGIIMAIINPGGLFFGPCLWFGSFTAIVIGMIYCGYRFIPYRPPQKALITIWGKRIDSIKEEGWILLAPYFPFLYDATKVNVVKINVDFPFKDIRTVAKSSEEEKREKDPEAGGEISVKISFTYIPDDLKAFIDSGGEEGVKNILHDMIEEDIREMGRDYDWEAFTFSTGELKNILIEKITGKKVEAGQTNSREKDRERDREMQKNGASDVMGLGIKLFRLNVGRIKEQGKLAEAAEAKVKEEQQRRGEEVELRFTEGWIKKMKDLGLSPGEATDAVQVQIGKGNKQVKTYRGLDNLGKAVGVSIIDKFLGGGEEQKKERKEEK